MVVHAGGIKILIKAHTKMLHLNLYFFQLFKYLKVPKWNSGFYRKELLHQRKKRKFHNCIGIWAVASNIFTKQMFNVV